MISSFLNFALTYWYIWVIVLMICMYIEMQDLSSSFFAVFAEAFAGGKIAPEEKKYIKRIKFMLLYGLLAVSACMLFLSFVALLAKFAAPYW